jgi:predicted RNase H-like HicB family nuclease
MPPMQNQFTAIFERDGEWWLGYVEELPGANTQGATLDEARENSKEAVSMVLEANRELAGKEGHEPLQVLARCSGRPQWMDSKATAANNKGADQE